MSTSSASLCYCDWSEKSTQGGACWSCFHNNCEPCCGEPCNFCDGCYCFMCWWCCGPCVRAKWWASQVDQDCACVNHCLPVCLLHCIAGSGFPYSIGYCLFEMLLRYNSRKEAGVYETPDTLDKYVGDFFLACCACTSPCALGQQLRTVPVSHWDCLGQLQEKGLPCLHDDFLLYKQPPQANKMDYHEQ